MKWGNLKDKHKTNETKRNPTKPKSKLFNFQKKKKKQEQRSNTRFWRKGNINPYKSRNIMVVF